MISFRYRSAFSALSRMAVTSCIALLPACAEMVDPLYPDYSSLVRLFVEYEAEYTDAANAFADDPEFVEVYCDGDYREGKTSNDGPFMEFDGDAASRYAEICGPLGLIYMRKRDRGIVFYHHMHETPMDKVFIPSFVLLGDRTIETQTCYLQTRLAETGTCILELNEHWGLMYQWAPSDEIAAMLE